MKILFAASIITIAIIGGANHIANALSTVCPSTDDNQELRYTKGI